MKRTLVAIVFLVILLLTVWLLFVSVKKEKQDVGSYEVQYKRSVISDVLEESSESMVDKEKKMKIIKDVLGSEYVDEIKSKEKADVLTGHMLNI